MPGVSVWITAWARWELQRGIDLVGSAKNKYGFIYCDTDSVKYVGKPDFTELNNSIIAEAEKFGAYAYDKNGKKHYLGVWEDEGTYDQFVTLGAKRYAYMEGGELHITVSGVNKKKGAEELKKRGGLEAFNDTGTGFTFRNTGKMEARYHDNVDTYIQREGRQLHITDNVVLKPTEYSLGLTADYLYLLEHPDFWMDIVLNK